MRAPGVKAPQSPAATAAAFSGPCFYPSANAAFAAPSSACEGVAHPECECSPTPACGSSSAAEFGKQSLRFNFVFERLIGLQRRAQGLTRLVFLPDARQRLSQVELVLWIDLQRSCD